MDDKFWATLEFNLTELRDLLNMYLESVEDAVGQQIPANPEEGTNAIWRDNSKRWLDEYLGDDENEVCVRPWLLIPYIDAIDQDALEERLEAGRQILPSIEARVAARELSPELVREWGLLNRLCGAIEIVSDARPDVGRKREGSKHLREHKRWYAHHFLKAYKDQPWSDAVEHVEKLINDRFNKLQPGPEKEWFGRFLSKNKSLSLEDAQALTRAFSRLTAEEMKAIGASSSGPIPYL